MDVNDSESDLSDDLVHESSVVASDNFARATSADGGLTVSTLPSLPTAPESTTIYQTPTIDADELFPSRYIKQAHSGNRKVAYVVFNGLSPGLYYNWRVYMFLPLSSKS